MIKAKEGAISVEGNGIELLADLSTAVRAVKETLMKTEKRGICKKPDWICCKNRLNG